MILPDANILIYAHNEASENHAQAQKWLEEKLQSSEVVCFSWQTITAFLRILTNSKLFANPLTLNQAFEIVEQWLSRPNAVVLEPTANFMTIFQETATLGQATGALVMDAHLAALAIDHGAVLATTDRDFRRFDGLKIETPF
jgi:toxin-antitoxin system PIN domain toxin